MVLVLSGANRVIQLFETDSVWYYLFFGFSLFAMFITVVVALSVPSFYAVIRFYKNLFSGEGYLSFTLPVTPAQHLWVKSITATVMTMAVGVVCILGCCLVMAGDVFTEVCKAIAYFGGKLDAKNTWNLIAVVAEVVILLAISTFAGHFVLYSCVCIGQLFRKHRILGAFGVYFIYYMATQFLSGIFSFTLELLSASGALDSLTEYTVKNPWLVSHIYLIGLLVVTLVQAVVCFVVCNLIMKRKLNLE